MRVANFRETPEQAFYVRDNGIGIPLSSMRPCSKSSAAYMAAMSTAAEQGLDL